MVELEDMGQDTVNGANYNSSSEDKVNLLRKILASVEDGSREIESIFITCGQVETTKADSTFRGFAASGQVDFHISTFRNPPNLFDQRPT